MDYLINRDEPDCIQNKIWMSDGELYLRTCKIPAEDILKFIEWLITNDEVIIDEVLSECIPQDVLKQYAREKLDMYTADEWMSEPEYSND